MSARVHMIDELPYLGSSSQTISGLTDAAVDDELVDLQGPHDVLALFLGHGCDSPWLGHRLA